MPNYRRNFLVGGTYFFTANLADRRLGLVDPEHRPAAGGVPLGCGHAVPFTIEAAVILPDHLYQDSGPWPGIGMPISLCAGV